MTNYRTEWICSCSIWGSVTERSRLQNKLERQKGLPLLNRQTYANWARKSRICHALGKQKINWKGKKLYILVSFLLIQWNFIIMSLATQSLIILLLPLLEISKSFDKWSEVFFLFLRIRPVTKIRRRCLINLTNSLSGNLVKISFKYLIPQIY